MAPLVDEIRDYIQPEELFVYKGNEQEFKYEK